MKTGKKIGNYLNVKFKSISENESLARLIISSFILPLNPTIEELNDIKTSVSEAVTNSIIHGYDGEDGIIELSCQVKERSVTIVIEDFGKGIEDIEKAREPMYTSKPQCERSGLGFSVMESFMDKVEVESHVGEGTRVTMYKDLV